MAILILICCLLVMWWVALTLLLVSDHLRQARSPRPEAMIPAEEMPPASLWPSWGDYLARPILFVIIPWCALVHAVVLFAIWPCFPTHRVFRPKRFTKLP
jgi:hypothetical protein